MPPPKVLHVAQPTEGGVARAVRELAADQRSRGWDVEVTSPAEPDFVAGVTSSRVLHRRWAATREPDARVLSETHVLRRILRSSRPDVVHLHSSKAGLCGRLAVRGGIPTIFQPHGWSFAAAEGLVRTGSAAWERRAARWTHALLCVSEEERRWGEREGVRGPYVVVPNGVDVARFLPPPSPESASGARTELGLGPGPVVLCLGRLSRQKGQDLLVAAWPTIRAAVPGATLVLVGEGPQREALASSAAVEGGVLLPGWAADPLPWLWAADVVALPSRWEGMAYAVLEAMAAGCSIVASEATGMREALGTGADGVGVTVPVEDVPGLAAAIIQRLADPHLRRREGAQARARVLALHDARRSREAVAELTLSLTNRGSR